MAVKTASFVGLESRTSSHKSRDSSTFCERTSASAFKAYGCSLAVRIWQEAMKHTFTSSFFGCFLSNLLQATIADLFEPVSNASKRTVGQ